MLQDRAALRVYTSKNSDFHGKTVEVVHDYGLHKLEVSNCVANLPRLLIPNRRLLLIGLSVSCGPVCHLHCVTIQGGIHTERHTKNGAIFGGHPVDYHCSEGIQWELGSCIYLLEHCQ